jgi:RNA polymerase sigma factor (sigma-70 family)
MSHERPVIADQLAAIDRDVDLMRGLATLPQRQREAVLLHYLADLDTAQTARVMGCSAGTVKAHLARGLAALRRAGLAETPSVDENESAR